MNKVDLNKVIEKIEIGMKSSLFIRNLITQNENKNDNEEFYKVLDHHSMLTLDSFQNSISMLKRFDCDDQILVEKRELDCLEDDTRVCKSEVFDDPHSPQLSIVTNETKVCNKRRKIGVESKEEVVTQLSDDGFAWRKYGQKKINDSNYPRNYYRCTHKFDKRCEATKQIQQLSETKFKIKYHATHTCNKNIIYDNTTYPYLVESQVEANSSSINFSFDGSSPINPLLFQAFGSPGSYNPTTSRSTSEVSCPVSSNSSNCEEITTEIENYSSFTATSVDFEEDYSFIFADLSETMPVLWDC